MEMTPVDFVSKAVCRIASDAGSLGRVFHLTNPDPVPAEEVFFWLEGMGYRLDRLDYRGWSRVWRESRRWAHGNGGASDGGLRGSPPTVEELWDGNAYDDRNTREALRGTGLRRPAIDASIFANYARHFAEQGWIEPFPKIGRETQATPQTGARRG